jgi:hypothetical protein
VSGWCRVTVGFAVGVIVTQASVTVGFTVGVGVTVGSRRLIIGDRRFRRHGVTVGFTVGVGVTVVAVG